MVHENIEGKIRIGGKIGDRSIGRNLKSAKAYKMSALSHACWILCLH